MKRVIGYVCEGPRDIEMFSAIINMLYPYDNNEVRELQPEGGGNCKNYTGWKGVLRWCYKDWRVLEMLYGKGNLFDMLIIQLDGDVSRSEKNRQSHCGCSVKNCDERAKWLDGNLVRFEECSVNTDLCPIQYPCAEHIAVAPDRYVEHLRNLIELRSPENRIIPYVVVVPCDSTDSWIVAAYESRENLEMIENPWETIIARKKDYMGTEIPKRKKGGNVYCKLIPKVVEQWDKVKEQCENAELFEKNVREILG